MVVVLGALQASLLVVVDREQGAFMNYTIQVFLYHIIPQLDLTGSPPTYEPGYPLW